MAARCIPVRLRRQSRVNEEARRGDNGAIITPNVIVHNGMRDHYVHAGARLWQRSRRPTASRRRRRESSANASPLPRWRCCGLSGWAGAFGGSAGCRCCGRYLVRASPFSSVTSGCTSRNRVASHSSALTATQGPTYYHQTYASGPELTTDASGQLLEERRTEPFGAAIDSFHDGGCSSKRWTPRVPDG